MVRRNPRQAIKGAFTDTEYESYIPFIIAMSQHETANFTSRLFREQNNLFGMKEAKRRQTLDIDDPKRLKGADSVGFSEFKSLKDSAEDLLLWMRFVRFPVNFHAIESFVSGLKRKSYFEDSISNYLNGVKRFL